MQKKLLRLAALLAFAVVAGLVTREGARAPELADRAPPRLGPCKVTHVTHGDTLNVRCGARKERVRMLQIDTPERGGPLYEEAGDAGAYPREFADAERAAREASMGIWAVGSR